MRGRTAGWAGPSRSPAPVAQPLQRPRQQRCGGAREAVLDAQLQPLAGVLLELGPRPHAAQRVAQPGLRPQRHLLQPTGRVWGAKLAPRQQQPAGAAAQRSAAACSSATAA